MRDLRTYLLTSTAILSLGSIAEAAPPTPYLNSWAGPYIGANIGVARSVETCSQSEQSYGYYGCAAYYGGTTQASAIGAAGGIQVGYDWQDQNFVYGVVADFDGTSLQTRFSQYSGYSTVTTRTDWLGSVRGRVGLAVGSTLVYGTGGLAFGHFQASDTADYGFYKYGSLNNTLVGWVAGGGIEHKITPRWSLFAEALYYDFPKAAGPSYMPYSTYTYQSEFQFDELVVRAGANWHF